MPRNDCSCGHYVSQHFEGGRCAVSGCKCGFWKNQRSLSPFAELKYGDRVTAYDPRIWNKRRKDVGNNEDCWLPAKVMRVYRNEGDLVADLLFDHDSEISSGHFIDGGCSGIREILKVYGR